MGISPVSARQKFGKKKQLRRRKGKAQEKSIKENAHTEKYKKKRKKLGQVRQKKMSVENRKMEMRKTLWMSARMRGMAW